MGLGTKRRQRQTGDICKQHLRARYPGLVDEFIVEIEGPSRSCDVTRWAQIAFLVSDKARWITGASIPVDDGLKL
jgi:NAD(P)-dependent dehydrogenase (short-subunit alcohol dehydrogenase family)